MERILHLKTDSNLASQRMKKNVNNTQPTMLPSGKDHTPPFQSLGEEERNTVNTQLNMFPYAKDHAPINKYQFNLGEEERNSVNLQTIRS